MILRDMPRPLALAVVGFASFVVALVVLPAVMLPEMIEENRWSQYPRGYGDYLVGMATLDVRFADGMIVVCAALVWAGLAVVFLAPIVGPPKLEAQGRSLVPSLIAAALLGSLACALTWVSMIEGVCAFLCTDLNEFHNAYGKVVGLGYITAALIWIAGGFVWYRLLARAGGTRDPAGLDRLVRRVFAGTCVELLLGTVFYLQVRRKTDCYCAMASFWNLVFGVATLLWMCGPWAVLLVTRKERSQWGRGACRQCGYPRRTDATVCPECGAEIAGAGGLSPAERGG